MKKSGRGVAWIILAVFCLVIFCSSAFIILHADHDCNGGDCRICTELAECCELLDTFGTAAAGTLTAAVMLCIAVLTESIIIKSPAGHTTLISLKVELLD